MKNLKSSKSKGFTLIELLVVISIISLLSSVVLASVSGVRERAEGAKIVGELKSTQTALELYINSFRTYPGNPGDVWEDSGNGSFNSVLTLLYGSGATEVFYSNIQNFLVNNKFIGQVPRSKNYPNNCMGSNNCNIFYYFRLGTNNNTYFCGGSLPKNYILGVSTNKKLNLPLFTVDLNNDGVPESTGFFESIIGNSDGINDYCLSM